MRRALLVCLGLLGLVAVLYSPAWAVERELAGVRLGAHALTLLNRSGFGQPDYIGPLGTIGGQAASTAARTGPAGPGGAAAGTRARAGGGAGGRGGAAGTRARAGGGAGGRGGTSGRGGRGGGRGGMRGAISPQATAIAALTPSFDVSLTQMGRGAGGGARRAAGGGGRSAGGGARRAAGGGGRSAGGGARRAAGGGGRSAGGGARRAAGGGGRSAGGAAGAGGAATRAGRRAATQTAGRVGQGQAVTVYWLYRRGGGATLVLALDAGGRVTAITLSGSLPYPGARTSRNIGLGNDYIAVIRQYGYADQVASQGTALDLTYVDHGVRFRLDGMRVTQITIGAHVSAAAPAAEAPVPTPTIPTPGLSVEELEGYM